MDRRWIGTLVAGALVALVAFAPYRETGSSTDRQGRLAGDLAPAVGDALHADASDPPDGSADGAGSTGSVAGPVGIPGGTGQRAGTAGTAPAGGAGADGSGGSAGSEPALEVPDLPEPTERELAVLGPLIAAMDTGQRAGTPLVLGVATSIIGTGLPSEQDLPPELRPVLSAFAQLLATPGEQVNDLTAENSVYLAQLDRALGELAFLNPALNAAIHQTAAQLAAFGRAAEPVSPPGAVFLTDLSILLTYFVVE